jgi:hypothetical protein
MSLSVSENKSRRKPPIPKITVETISNQIAHIMEFINKHPEITQEQLKALDRKIKSLYEQLETAYLVESKSPNRQKKTPTNPTRKTVRFSPGTKTSRGGKTRRRRRK